MGAIVRVVPDKDMEIIKKYITEHNMILIPESIAIQENVTAMDEEQLEYDFGTDADVWIDIVKNERHHAIPYLKGEDIE